MSGIVLTLFLASAANGDVPRLAFEVVARVPIQGQKPVYSLVKAGANGLIYVGDHRSAEIQALARTGQPVWSTALAPEVESHRRALRAMALDRQGLLFALESGSGSVHVMDGETGKVVRQVSVREAVGTSPQTGLAPDDTGGFYLLGLRGPITHFPVDGVSQTFGHPSNVRNRRDLALDGWVGTGVDGTIYHRPPYSVVFHRFDRSGRSLASIVARIPYSDSAAVEPGDMVLNGGVLSDGRVVCQVLHATPFRRGPGAIPSTEVQSRIYLLDAQGSPVGILDSDKEGLGNLAGVTASDHLVFLLPAEFGGPMVTEIELSATQTAVNPAVPQGQGSRETTPAPRP